MKTLKKEALEHWNRIACGSITEFPTTAGCPYCQKYFRINCVGCAIRELTGMSFCRDTPYCDIAYAYVASKHEPTPTPWQSRVADEIEVMIELIESLPEDE